MHASVAAIAVAALLPPATFVTAGHTDGRFVRSGDTIRPGAHVPSALACTGRAPVVRHTIRIHGGRFVYDGPASGVHVRFTGTFTSSTRARGHATVSHGSCRSTISWSARVQRTDMTPEGQNPN